MAKKRGAAQRKEQSAQTPKANRQLVVTGAEEAPTFYANSANVEVSNWDIRIRLGQILAATDSVLHVKEVASVYMSHSHAKAFLKALSRVLEKMEPLEKPTPHREGDTTH